jgi:hypothetical protein
MATTRRPILLGKGILGDTTINVSDFPSSASSSSSISETSLPRSHLTCFSNFLFFLSSFASLYASFRARFAALVALLLGSGRMFSEHEVHRLAPSHSKSEEQN